MNNKENRAILDWLLEPDQPVARYHALVQLLGRSTNDPEVREAHSQIPRRGWAKAIFDEQKPGGYWELRKSLYQPKYLATNWRMLVLADFGLTLKNTRFKAGCDLYFKDWLSSDDEFEADAEVCVSGNLASTLVRAGYSDH